MHLSPLRSTRPRSSQALALTALVTLLGCAPDTEIEDAGPRDAPRSDAATGDALDAPPPGVDGSVLAVRISPRARTVRVGTTLALEVEVTGGAGVSLAVEEPDCGTIDAGIYTAPAAVPTPPTCHVRASALADPSVGDRATLTIVDAASVGTPGVWEDVTPDGIRLDPAYHRDGNFGVQDVLVDPARPSDVYAFTTYQGCWRSTDFGRTWAMVSTGRNGDVLMTGRMWGAAVASDARRDPSTPPTLYTFNGYGSTQGLFRSSDGGVNWDHIVLPDGANGDYPQDAYDIDVDPYDVAHLVLGYHGSGLSESLDGGDTWRPIPTAESVVGGSPYVFFVDTGEPESTARTWLAIGQWESNEDGVQRTTDRGVTWTRIATAEHGHGNAQIFNAGGGVVYFTGIGAGGGIFRSDDAGATVTRISDLGGNTIIGTSDFLYLGNGWANADGADPGLLVAPRTADSEWTAMITPPEMTNGPKRSAVTFDGSHAIVINGSWNAGIWRYVEP